jgi:hypothetical protein
MWPKATLLVAACSAAFLVACPVGACDTSIVPSIVVEVRDSITGVAAAAEAVGVATSGAHADTLAVYGVDYSLGDTLSLAMRGERAGNYAVRVAKAGLIGRLVTAAA